MSASIVCSHDPIFIKSVYGILRDTGFSVDVEEHSAVAVRRVLCNDYSLVLLDARSFGLSAENAVQVIRSVSPHTLIVTCGMTVHCGDAVQMAFPLNLEEFKSVISNLQHYNYING